MSAEKDGTEVIVVYSTYLSLTSLPLDKKEKT